MSTRPRPPDAYSIAIEARCAGVPLPISARNTQAGGNESRSCSGPASTAHWQQFCLEDLLRIVADDLTVQILSIHDFFWEDLLQRPFFITHTFSPSGSSISSNGQFNHRCVRITSFSASSARVHSYSSTRCRPSYRNRLAAGIQMYGRRFQDVPERSSSCGVARGERDIPWSF